MKNVFTIIGCCLISAAAFAATNLPGKPAGRPLAASTQSLKASHEAVLICHKGREITVDAHAVPAHLAHGDKVGSCASTPPGDVINAGVRVPNADAPVPTPVTSASSKLPNQG